MHNLSSKYVSALTDNKDECFEHSLSVVSSFCIFDPLSTPIENSELLGYGQKDIQTLGNHFLVERRTAASVLNWKRNGTTLNMSRLTGVRTIKQCLLPLRLPQNGPCRGSYGRKNPTTEVIPFFYR